MRTYIEGHFACIQLLREILREKAKPQTLSDLPLTREQLKPTCLVQ